jgi:hypothetical protein
MSVRKLGQSGSRGNNKPIPLALSRNFSRSREPTNGSERATPAGSTMGKAAASFVGAPSPIANLKSAVHRCGSGRHADYAKLKRARREQGRAGPIREGF